MTRAYLSLGSNIEPEKNLRAALDELRAQFGSIDVSPAYRFPAEGFAGPDFLNLAVGIDTPWDVHTLNDWLHELEDRHGRQRDIPRFSSRTLDVDIVLFGNDVLKGSRNLEIPRSDLRHAFVLKPLSDIAPHAVHPLLGKSLSQLWREHQDRNQKFLQVALA